MPRLKSNSKKRATIVLKGKDSRNVPSHITPANIRPNRSSVKRTPMGYSNANQGRTKSTNNKPHLKDRIKTIEYNDSSNFRSIMARSNTVQKRRKLPINNNFATNESSIKPYINFVPSSNTRSNITIDRSGSSGYGKLGFQIQNPTSLSNITNKKSNSRKMMNGINEYEDDSIVTINSNNFAKRSNANSNLTSTMNNESNMTMTSNTHNVSNKELIKKPKFTKIMKKDGVRSKSNNRTIKDNFERVYMQSPCKLNRKPNLQPKLKKTIENYDSQGSFKGLHQNQRDNSVSPSIPRTKDSISNVPRHKSGMKERKDLNFNSSLKNEISSILPVS